MTNQPPAWIDGHPLMEAIATAVHKHCTTGDGGIVHDDPRNIAAAAVTAMTALPAPPGCTACQIFTPEDIKILAGLARGHDLMRICRDLTTNRNHIRGRIERTARRLGFAGQLQPQLVNYGYLHRYLESLTPEPRQPIASLSPRLTQALDAVARGLTVDESADEMGVRPRTARTHRMRLYACLDAHANAHAVAIGWQLGLLGPGSEAAR